MIPAAILLIVLLAVNGLWLIRMGVQNKALKDEVERLSLAVAQREEGAALLETWVKNELKTLHRQFDSRDAYVRSVARQTHEALEQLDQAMQRLHVGWTPLARPPVP